jgi:Ca2+-binding EF-hand superfamily protein
MGNQQTASTFSGKDLEVLIKTSGKNENEIRQWYNEFRRDSNDTNRMNKRQFQQFYTKLSGNPNVQQITDHIFRAFDADHSGKIVNFEV